MLIVKVSHQVRRERQEYARFTYRRVKTHSRENDRVGEIYGTFIDVRS